MNHDPRITSIERELRRTADRAQRPLPRHVRTNALRTITGKLQTRPVTRLASTRLRLACAAAILLATSAALLGHLQSDSGGGVTVKRAEPARPDPPVDPLRAEGRLLIGDSMRAARALVARLPRPVQIILEGKSDGAG